MNDEQLERLAPGLGRRAADNIDLQRTSDAVLARLRLAHASRWGAMPAWLKAAAVVTLLVGGALFTYRVAQPSGPGSPVAIAAPAHLQALSVNELQHVLDSLAADAPAHALAAAGLASLDEGQLEELLRLMEG